MKLLKAMLCAFGFLTVIPAPSRMSFEKKDLGRSMAFYPVVGLFLGGACLGMYHFSLFFFPPFAGLVFALILSILLTGALHIDGFADVCDGFYAGKNKEDILRIMKDSHSGVMAVTGIFCLLLLKLALWFSCFKRGSLSEAFLLAPSVSRWMMVLCAVISPYARAGEGTAKPFVENAGFFEVMVSSVLLFVICYGVSGALALKAALAACVVSLLFLRWTSGKLGGVTGDVLGAVNEICEVSVLMTLSL